MLKIIKNIYTYKRFLLNYLGLLGLFFLSSCQSGGEKGDNRFVRINISGEVQSLDPRLSRDLSSSIVLSALFDGLTRLDKDGKPTPAIAEKIDISEDGKIYTFHLREAYWSNGDVVKASDFAYSWKKSLSPSFPSDNAFQLYVIKNAKNAKTSVCHLDDVGIRVLDDKTLCVELENPTPYFLTLLSRHYFFPINELVDRGNPKWFQSKSTYVSNGPFNISKWEHDYTLSLKKSKNYWDKENVKIPGLKMLMVDGDTEIKMFENNEIDWAGSPISTLPLDVFLSFSKKVEFHKHEYVATYFLRVNTKDSFLKNVNIRKALSLAMDRDSIVEHALRGSHIVATGLVPTNLKLNPTLLPSVANKELAQKFWKLGLRDLGMVSEENIEISFSYINSERGRIIAQAVQQQWFEMLGFNLKLECVESKSFYNRISRGDFQLALGSWFAEYDDPYDFLNVFKYKDSGTNNTGWENKNFQDLLDLSCKTADVTKRSQILGNCEKILIKEMPVIPIFHVNMFYLKSEKLDGVIVSGLGDLDFKNSYWKD